MKQFIVGLISLFFVYAPPVQANAPGLMAAVNVARTAQGAGVLKDNPFLDLSAQTKACDMYAHGYFSHNKPDGTVWYQVIIDSGYKYGWVGEDLGRNIQGDTELVNAFLASPTHRKILLDPQYTDIGAARCGKYAAVHFGRK